MSLPSCEVMFDLLGRWHLSAEFARNSIGLLTPTELSRALLALQTVRSPLRP